MSELKFKFKMPDDESLAEYISVKGEKGEKGDPTKLSQLDNDTNFVSKNTTELENYYTKAQTDSAIEAEAGAIKTELGVPDGFFTDASDTVTGEGSLITLNDTANAVFKDIKLYGDALQQGTPTPENPVDVQVVTGEQTIIISGNGQQSQSYTLSLGDIELCKLGSYQDYIYKGNDGWYLHKETDHATIDSLSDGVTYSVNASSTNTTRVVITKCLAGQGIGTPDSARLLAKCNRLQTAFIYSSDTVGCFIDTDANLTKNGFVFRAAKATIGTDSTSVEAWLNENPLEVYYVLATATDELITDWVLVDQLRAIDKARGYDGTTVISISGSLTSPLIVEAFTNNWNGTISGVNTGLDGKADKELAKQKPFYFNSVAEMKAYSLNDGDLAITSGYYFANDGGGAKYAITSEQLTADDAFILELSNGAYAKLIIENSQVNIRQLGAQSQGKNNTKYDIAPYITKYISRVGTANTIAVELDKTTLYIPSGVWYSSALEISGLGFSIIGDEQFMANRNRGTVISSLEDNQEYIFNFHDSTNFTLKNICFSTADFRYDSTKNILFSNVQNIKNISQSCVLFRLMSFGDTDNLYFQHINGQAFEMASCWEIRFRKMFFRDIDAHSGYVFKFAKFIEGASGDGGVNACSFDNMMFEHVLGHLMYLESNCKLYNCYFGVINFEDNEIVRAYAVPTEFTDENIPDFEASNPVHYAVFYIGEAGTGFAACIINSIQLNNISTFYYTLDGTNYCYDNIFRLIGSGSLFEIIVNNIDSLGIKKDATILYSHDAVHYQSSFILNNISSVYPNSKEFIYDVEGFTYIRNDGRIRAVTDNIVPRLTNSATPAYKNVDNRGTGRGNLLKSDRTAKNEIGVCVKLSAYFGAFSFYKASEKLYINAKIPNGQTAKIFLNSGTRQKVDCVGTGAFKVYEIDLDANNVVGDVIHVALANENTADYCLVDYFIN